MSHEITQEMIDGLSLEAEAIIRILQGEIAERMAGVVPLRCE
jgi:hypothetical protein